MLEEVGLKEEVGNLLSEKEFKDEAYEEGIDHTLTKLKALHVKIEIIKERKHHDKLRQRELEQQEWLKLMSVERKENDKDLIV